MADETPWVGVLEANDAIPTSRLETGWRGFLRSRTLAALLVAACVFGVIAIVNANPFASASVSERISAKVGEPTTCTEVGAARVAGVDSKLYRCTVSLRTTGFQCFAITGDDVRQLVGRRELGC